MSTLDEMKEEGLPKSINLHSMSCVGVEYNADPTYIGEPGYQELIREDKRTTFDLIDHINGIEVRITISKTTHYNPTEI
jgi:hypothetical protein